MTRFWTMASVCCAIFLLIVVFLIANIAKGDNIVYVTDDGSGQPEIRRDTPVRGAVTGTTPKVTIVIFSDYECEGCADQAAALTEIVTEYPGQVIVAWKDLPNPTLHPASVSAAIAARCAGEQKTYWAMHDLLFANQDILGRDAYVAAAMQLGLKEKSFTKCIDKESPLPYIQTDMKEAQALGITATPTIFINEQRYTGLLRAPEINTIIRPMFTPTP